MIYRLIELIDDYPTSSSIDPTYSSPRHAVESQTDKDSLQLVGGWHQIIQSRSILI